MILIDIQTMERGINNSIRKLNLLHPDNDTGSRIIREVALNYMAEMRDRIQNRGKASDGSDIGKYSTKPTYISIDQMDGRKLKPEGKEFKGKRRSTFASGKKKGKPHSSRYFEDGYEQYKTEAGRNTLGKVNLTFTGQFFNQMQLLPVPQGWGVGWSGAELLARAKKFESSKMYGKDIFEPTKQERERAV